MDPIIIEERPCPKGMVRDPRTRQCVRSTDLARSIEELVDAALFAEQWRDWYVRSYETLQTLFGPDLAVMAKLLAATSVKTKVANNVAEALKAYRMLVTGVPFTGFLPA